MLVVACAPENNSWLGKGYHNITSHYNGYFYSLGEITKIEQTILKSQSDDYNRVLKLFPALDTAMAKGYDKEAQEAIKMASHSIQRHPNSKWTDDAYILVGKARLYTMDWGNAIQTFKYVNSKSKDPNSRHRAIIYLIRTFVEHQEYDNAQSAIDFLLKQKLNKPNLKNFYLEKAYFHQTQHDYSNMVKSLTKVDNLLKKKDRNGRIYFIIGQVYQKLGLESEAYSYYRKCLATNPEYEIDFYARLYLAQVTEISHTKNINVAYKSFKKLLNDGKNKEFKDKIYYEMGVFELKHKNLKPAITNLKIAVRTGKNSRVDGEAYLLLGEIYYDTLKNYELAQAYYDSALSSLPQDFDGYEAIKSRTAILNEFVKNLKIIQWQDSLLTLVSLDSVTLRSRIDASLTAKRISDEKMALQNKRNSNRIQINANNNNNLFGDTEDENQETQSQSDWYFGNTSVIALGQNEFSRVWGNIVLEDNWRRSQRGGNASELTSLTTPDAVSDSVAQVAPTAKVDPVDAEYARVNQELPRTKEQREQALSKIEDAYYALGDLYYFKLLEKPDAVTWYKKLMQRFPESEYTPEVLYKLYLIAKEIDTKHAEEYATLLKLKHPHSTFAKILLNPNYLKENGEAIERQKVLYKTAYQKYQAGDYAQANQIINEAKALAEESLFIPNLELLKIIIMAEVEDINKYQYALDSFIKLNPDAEVTSYAKTLLNTSREFQQKQEKQNGIAYIRSFEESHYFVVLSNTDEKIDNLVSVALEGFNKDNFGDLKLKTSSLVFNDEYVINMVAELPRISFALEYYKTFIDKLPELTALQNHKISTFVITKDNFDIFYRTKGLHEYFKFFEKNYHTENQ